jgi:membrane-bound serine protease (ClpP class)
MLVVLALVGLFLLPAPWGVIAVALAAAVEVLELAFWRWFARRYKLRSGPEMLIGMRATVVEACAPMGRVRVRGEYWTARSAGAPVEAGEEVTITALDGLTLDVEPAP